LKTLKAKLPSHLSLVDEVAELLDISNDNAYRKICGETAVSLEEISKVAAYFKISIDQALNLQTDGGTYTGKYVTAENFNFEKYLEQQLNDLRFIASFKQKELTYVSKDIPFVYYYAFRN
jgi:plasmid maintenance system antidote protein VapI